MSDVANLTIQVNSSGVTQATSNLNSLQNQGTSTTSVMRTLGGAIAALGLVGLGRTILQTNIEFENLRTSLVTATGSIEAAAIAFERVQKFAAQTPFSVKELTTAFITLKNLGLDPSEAALTSLGNTAGATGKSLTDTVRALSGAVTGEFDGLKAFGITTKSEGDKVIFTFRGVATEVGKNTREIQDFLLSLGNVEFAGGSARQANTLQGAISNLGDEFDRFSDLLLNDSSSAGLQGAVRLTTASLTVLSDNVQTLGDVAAAIGIIITAKLVAPLVVTGATLLIVQLQSVQTSIALAALSGTSVLASASLTALAGAAALANTALKFFGGKVGLLIIAASSLVFFATKAKEATKSTEDLAKNINKLTVEAAGERLKSLGKTLKEASFDFDKAEFKIRNIQRQLRRTPNDTRLQADLKGFEDKLASAQKNVETLKTLETELTAIVNDPDREATLKAAADAQILADTKIVESAAKRSEKLLALKNAQDKLLTQSASFLQSIKSPLELFKDQEALLLKFSKTVNDATGKKLITDDQLQEGIRRARVEMEALIASASLENFNQEASASESLIKSLQTASEGFAESFANALIDGGTSFENFANGILKQLQKIALQKAFAPIFGGFSDMLGGLLPVSGADFIGPVQPSFNGGGFTGSGPRSGGVDGRGGFNAVLHPNETVIDHTKGQSMGGNMSVVVNVDASGSSSSGDAEGQNLGNLIGIAVRSVLIEESRPGGILA